MNALLVYGLSITFLLYLNCHLQAAGSKADRTEKYRGTAHAILKIYEEEGMGGFYNGMRAKIVQSVLAVSALPSPSRDFQKINMFAIY